MSINDQNSMFNEAEAAFKNGSYGICSSLLNDLKNLGTCSRSVISANEALVEFAQSGWTAQDEYLEKIKRLKEDVKKTNNRAVLLYNEAVVAFYARRWSSAINLLQGLFDSNGSCPVSAEAALLLSECHLRLFDPDQALVALSVVDGLLASSSRGNVTELQKRRCFMTKIRCYLMMRNGKRCKKEMKSMPVELSPSLWVASVLKAHQEYLRENYRKSLRLMVNANESASSRQANGDSFIALFNNALGCNYAKLNKFHLATSYFEKAIKEYQEIRNRVAASGQKGKPLALYHCQTDYWAVLHNYALSLLQAGFADQAFDSFLHVVKAYPKNARLWLRLAECCIVARRKNNSQEFILDQRRHECVRDVVGIGPHRKIVLNTNLSNKKRNEAMVDQGAVPTLSYDFACLCLKNAMFALPKITQDHLRTITESPTNSASSSEKEIVLLWPCPPENPLGIKELYRLKCSILCCMSHVCLSVNDYYGAVDASRQLLAMDSVSPVHRMLSRSYAAEALVALNRIHEATTHLSSDPIISDMTVSEFYSGAQGLPPSDWWPKSAKSATMAFLYNVGVLCTLKGDTAKASEITKLVRAGIGNGGECPVLAIAQMLHQLLQKGEIANARMVLSRFFPYLQIEE